MGRLDLALEPAALPGAAAAFIDTATAGGVEAALAARAAVPGAAVFRCARSEVRPLVAALSPDDGISLADEPVELLCFRLEATCLRARRDGLTGVADKRAFADALSSASSGLAGSVSLIVIDIDHLKHVNDRHGHAAGDRTLRDVARRLRGLMPPGGTLARVGGGEFAVLCPVGPGDVRDMAGRLLDAIRGEPIEGRAVTASAGCAGPDAGRTGDELWRDANEALFAAKTRGRDRAVHWDDMRRESLARNSDLALAAFENRTRVMTERVVESINARGRRLFSELRLEADCDPVTQLYSRRYLDRRMPFELDADREAGAPTTVALIDVDFFGQINKGHGWPSGDRVLAEAAARIRRTVRAEDWVARYGGDEICVVMRGVGREQAHSILERIRHAIAGEAIASTTGEPLALTVSIGATEAESTDDVMALLERASARLNEAKRGGRNRVCL
jgi:two-component system, cell cycle response regulator